MEEKFVEENDKKSFADLSQKDLNFEGFEGAFGSENFQDHCDTSTSNNSDHPAADSLTSNVGGGIKSHVTASPGIKYGYGVAASMLPTLSLSWFGGSTDKNPSEAKDSTSIDHHAISSEPSTATPDDKAAAVSNCMYLTFWSTHLKF